MARCGDAERDHSHTAALPRNPCRIRGAGQPNSPERPLLTVEDVDALATAIRPHLHALVLVGFWGHLRLGELLGLERADVDLDEGTVRVKSPGGRDRRRPRGVGAEGSQSPNGVPAGAGD
jgi:integrase